MRLSRRIASAVANRDRERIKYSGIGNRRRSALRVPGVGPDAGGDRAAGVTLAGDGADSYRLGARLSLGQSFSLNLEADRNVSAAALPEHGLRLSGTLRR